MSNNKFVIFTDGAARGNPGPAASSFVISTPEGKVLEKGGDYIGVATNNQAEYRAVKGALEKLIEIYPDGIPAQIELRSDSTLVVNQLSGKYKIKNEQIKTLIEEIKNLELKTGPISYVYIPRSNNALADLVANQILDRVADESQRI